MWTVHLKSDLNDLNLNEKMSHLEPKWLTLVWYSCHFCVIWTYLPCRIDSVIKAFSFLVFLVFFKFTLSKVYTVCDLYSCTGLCIFWQISNLVTKSIYLSCCGKKQSLSTLCTSIKAVLNHSDKQYFSSSELAFDCNSKCRTNSFVWKQPLYCV